MTLKFKAGNGPWNEAALEKIGEPEDKANVYIHILKTIDL